MIQSIRKRRITSNAEADALIGQQQAEGSVLALIGPRPAFAPESNSRDLQDSRAINIESEARELEDDLHLNETGLAESPSLQWMNLAITGLFVVEVLGSVSVMKAMRVENPERMLFGIGLAAILFLVTSRLAVIQSRIRFAIQLIAYIAIVGGIAIIRSTYAGDEDTTNAVGLGQVVVLLAATIGPAFVFDTIWRRRAPVIVLAKKARGLRRHLKRLRKGQQKAQRRVNRIESKREIWEKEHARLSAIYITNFNRLVRPSDQPAHRMFSNATLTRRR